jgi:hypothetical protein
MAQWVVAILLAVLASAAVSCALNDRDGEEPPGWARRRATPDVTHTKDAGEARDELVSVDPDLAKLIDAVSTGDVHGVLALVDWQKETCGVRRAVSCGAVPDGETVEVVNAGWPVAGFVTAEVLRPSLGQLLGGTPLQLRYAAQSIEQPSVYYLGFDGPEVKGKGLAPLADTSSDVTGVFFTVDTSRERPIVLVEPGLSQDYSAVQRGSEPGFEKQRLIVLDDDY